MERFITTKEVDASVALKAYGLYKEGQYSNAVPVLLDILDMEPQNWQARLLLAVCYSETDQPMAAERAIRFVYEKCSDEVYKQKACFALQAIRSRSNDVLPAEFQGLRGRHLALTRTPPRIIF